MKGKYYSNYKFWDSSSELSNRRLIRELEVLPELAEEELADSAKDVSMAGVIGSILMLLECSEKGADIYIDNFSLPSGVKLDDWLLTFPSYGFILATRADKTERVEQKFKNLGLQCEKIGKVKDDRKINFISGNGSSEIFWDFKRQSYIGLNSPGPMKVING